VSVRTRSREGAVWAAAPLTRGALPCGPREPAALQTLEWVVRPTAFLRRCAAAHGEAFTIRLAFDDAPLVLVWDPDAVRAVYTASPLVARRGASPGPLRPIAGPNSILLADGDDHLRIRRLMLPPFHGDRVAAYRAVVGEVTAEHVARWPRDRPVAALALMQELTLAVILRAVFGTDDPRLATDIRATLGVATSLPRAAAMSLVQRDLGPRSPWGAFVRRMVVVDEQLMALIARRRQQGAGGDDVLGQLIAAGLDDHELRDHLVTLLAAGHETTAGALAWAIERLARAPDVLTHVRAGDEDWIDAVVKETLRIRPVLTVAPRKLAEPLAIGGRELPAGVHVTVHLPRAPPRGPLPRRAPLAPGTLAGRRGTGVVCVDTVRRRSPALPGSGLRDDGDGRGATDRGRPARRLPHLAARRADAPARAHAHAGPRCAGRAQRCFFARLVLTVFFVARRWR
jgi:cytochrome P450 family 135